MLRHHLTLLFAGSLLVVAGRAACGEPPTGPDPTRPKTNKPSRIDAYGDPLPEGAIGRLGSARLYHIGEVRSLVFSRDGNTLFVGCHAHSGKFGNPRHEARSIWVFETATGKWLAHFGNQIWGSESLALSPDGKTLASAEGGGSIDLWDVATRKPIRHFRDFGKASQWCLAWSPNGSSVAVCGDGVELLRATDGKVLHRFDKDKAKICSITFSPDGRLLAAADLSGGVCLWDVTAGKPVARLEAGTDCRLVFAPDGCRLAGGDAKGVVRLWEVPSGKVLQTLRGPVASHHDLAFSPDGKTIAVAFGDTKIHLWDPASGHAPRVFEGHRMGVGRVAFSPDGKTLASGGSWDVKVKLWDVATGKERPIGGGHAAEVLSLAYSPDGKMLTSGDHDATIRLWDTTSATELRHFSQRDGVVSLTFAADGKRLLSTQWYSPNIRVWDVGAGKQVAIFGYYGETIAAVVPQAGGKAVSVSQNGMVRRGTWSRVGR
jgi:WD40 repeat protein